MLLPWIVTSVTWPRLTSFRKSENASVDCGPRVEEVWNRLNRATRSRPMTIHRARFLPKLFTLIAFPNRPARAAEALILQDLPRPFRGFRASKKIGCRRY